MGIFEKEKEEPLSYDGHAFLYFALTGLTVVLLPWTWYLAMRLLFPRPPEELDFDSGGQARPKDAAVRLCTSRAMEAKKRWSQEGAFKRRFRGLNGLLIVGCAVGWVLLFQVVWQLQDAPQDLRTFDPYDILGIARSADLREIKKAYRAKSLQHHPDKDKDNPLAPVLFQQVSKAYAALTDESARTNYEKYGNPDGPGQMKVGIALHPALLIKERQIFVLCCFFSLLFGVPLSIVCCCLRGSNVSSGGVSGETLKIFHACIDAELSAEDTVGLLVAASEVRKVPGASLQQLVMAMAATHPEELGYQTHVRLAKDVGQGPCEKKGRVGVIQKVKADGKCEVSVWPVHGPPQKQEDVEVHMFPLEALEAVEPRIPCPFSDNVIRRGAALFFGHMWRQHEHFTEMNKVELTHKLLQTPKLCRAMISIAARGEGDRANFAELVKGCVKLQRCLVQALDFDDDPLHQLPAAIKKVPASAPSLREVVESGGSESMLKRIGSFTPEQVLDIQAFCRHAPLMEMSYVVEVSDEQDMAEGDMATLKLTLTRTNLAESECVGPVHAPLFPGAKFEEWWVIIYDNRGRRLVTADLVQSTGRTATAKINFMLPRHGEWRWTAFAMCDSYAGLDIECDLNFSVKKRSQVDRSIFVHPEDADIRSFFEELMMGLEPRDEDSSSEEEEDEAARSQQLMKREAKKVEKDGLAVKATEASAAEASKLEDTDAETEEEKAIPEGVFFRIKDVTGAFLYREPAEAKESRIGSVPTNTVMRGFISDGRPDGWLEVAAGTRGIWVKVDGATVTTDEESSAPGLPAERLGSLVELSLQDLVKAHTPIVLLKRWMHHTTREITAEDLLHLRDIENTRMRIGMEELALKRLGDERFSKLLDEAQLITEKFKTRIKKARGFFRSANGIVWHVAADGEVKGLHADGNRIRDKVSVGADDTLQIGPFNLDEEKPCSCIHWIRRAEPDKSWTWSRDDSLRTRVRLATGERAP
eukprot:TRINITY_DN61606_c0_g1_i1.p1 TRINITY_DN61606_c0_g1~~TRINITY_DN61606_c0_g1_i1.p1  ORF type:complete len:984 (+),score=224.00 TRINITY_DN61606_c0_g1_i1:83-3034(+)